MLIPVPDDWRRELASELDQPYFQRLCGFVDAERQEHLVFPPEDDVFHAFRLTPFDQVRVVILGQDPYHDVGQAHGLAFSVRPGCKIPPSLRNIYKELADDIPGFEVPATGYLAPWVKQGVLLLNTVLTVRAHAANSHRGKGWERFTDAALSRISASHSPVVFVLWGTPAQSKLPLIDVSRHCVVQSVHPSPLSAYRGFLGSRPFSRINHQLEEWGRTPIDWNLGRIG